MNFIKITMKLYFAKLIIKNTYLPIFFHNLSQNPLFWSLATKQVKGCEVSTHDGVPVAYASSPIETVRAAKSIYK